LHETIVGFHNSVARFQTFTQALETGFTDRIQASQAAIHFILDRAPIFETIVALGLPVRTTHNDTKLDNVLLDSVTHKGVCVIDLDTVMPGTILSDFGDMVRTFTNTETEDSNQYHTIQINWQVYEALCKGFLEIVGKSLTTLEVDNLVLGAKWMILEQAMRFLTDYLSGDSYYKVRYANHNFVRACNQIALLQAIEHREQAMMDVVRNCL
jgi:thiamine kinase-like enzyme